MTFQSALPSLALATLLLAACGDTSEVEESGDPALPAPVAKMPAEPVLPEPLSAEDLSLADLDGELGCSFTDRRGGDPLLVGFAFVADDSGAEGVMRVDGEIVPLTMNGAGGYNRMADGVTFMGEGLMAQVEVTGDGPLAEEPQIAMESPVVEAQLTVSRGTAPEAVYDGFYECGP